MDVSLWSVLLLASVFFLPGGCQEDCLLPLGMEDGRIKDEKIRASSFKPLAKATYARLNHADGYGGWCPDQEEYDNLTDPIKREFIRIEFDTPLRIKGIVTQGRHGGLESVEKYWVTYSPVGKGTPVWYYGGNIYQLRLFEGNSKHIPQKENILKPPIIADAIRIVPRINPKRQVCLRLELLGCSPKNGLFTYKTLQGNTMEEKYNFTDSSYDGLIEGNTLLSGLGRLTDGHLAPVNYAKNNGVGWIGWNSKDTPNPYIIFEFLSTRIFYSLTIHCNVRDEADVKLFSRVTVRFKEDGATLDKPLTHKPKQISSGTGWKNYNVTVDLCQNVGKFVKLNFTYAGDWILISEVTFNSEPLGEKSPPLPVCASIPPLSTKPPTTGRGGVITTNSPTDGIEGIKGGETSNGSGSLNGGVIAAIICSVLVVLVAVALFICCKRYPHWLSQREKPFNSFIKVEVKPYARYQSSQRVSRLDSTASENEEKRGSLKNNVYNEAGEKRGAAEVTISPIYASIRDDLNKGAVKSDEQNNVPNCERHSEHKSSKKDKRPIPPPLKPPEPPSEVIYAEPNTPLWLSSTNGGSPKHATLQSLPQVDLTEESDAAYSDYAEPDSPCEKNSLIPNSPQPRVVSGYADPIDVISPTSLNTFPNPIYEEIYSEPFQGVTGTSMYCNPDEELNFRPRLDTLKELPRNRLHFKEKIGDGQFGEVYIGEVERLGDILGGELKNNPRTTVAIKTLKLDVDKNIKDDFFKEVKAMAGLKHSNVIRLLGVCRDDPMCMIVEYMANGDLNQFLKERELTPSWSENDRWQDAGQYISLQALFFMAKQVAAGMKYISSLNYVHRDLATRNCLVGHAYTVKIADFGMSRNLYSKHYYRVEGRVILPIRWMAPECILQGRFTTSGDVWAFGVTLWEILTLAKEYPYSELTDEEVIDNAQKIFHGTGKPCTRLPQPETCPDDLYRLMCCCWTREMEDRPPFMELHSNIAERVRFSEVSMEC